MTFVNRPPQRFTDTLPRYTEKTFHLSPEDTGVTPSTSRFQPLHFVEYSADRTQSLDTSREYGGGSATGTNLDAPDPDFGDVDITASLTTRLCLNEFYFACAMLFGAPVTTSVAGGKFQHVFTSGKGEIPLGTLRDRDSQNTRLVGGVGYNTLEMAIARSGGTQLVTHALLPQTYDLQAASDLAAGDQLAEVARLFVPKTDFRVEIGGTRLGRLIDANLNYTNDLQGERYVDGTDGISASYVGDPLINLSFGVRHATEAQRAALGGRDNPMDVALIGDGPDGTSVRFAAPRVIGPVVYPTKDDKLNKLSFEGQASKNTGGAALSVTLVNTIDPTT